MACGAMLEVASCGANGNTQTEEEDLYFLSCVQAVLDVVLLPVFDHLHDIVPAHCLLHLVHAPPLLEHQAAL